MVPLQIIEYSYHQTLKLTTANTCLAFENRDLIRLEYDYEIEYENDFSVLVCRLHIITTQASQHPMSFPLYLNTNM